MIMAVNLMRLVALGEHYVRVSCNEPLSHIAEVCAMDLGDLVGLFIGVSCPGLRWPWGLDSPLLLPGGPPCMPWGSGRSPRRVGSLIPKLAIPGRVAR